MAGPGKLAAGLAFFAAAGLLQAQPRLQSPSIPYSQGAADPIKGKQILDDFRQKGGLAPGYYLTFELEVRPRHGDGPTVPGRLWTGRLDRLPVTRVELQPGVAGAERRLLVQAGPDSQAWTWPDPGGGVATVRNAALFAPLAGTDLTAFDLQMPFLYWADATFEGDAPAPESGRPAAVFLLKPPADIAALKPELAGVEVYLDTEYNALVEAKEIGRAGQPLKSITVRDFKKVDQGYIMKTIDLRNETTRDTTRFEVTAAESGLEVQPAWFDPARLGEAVQPPPDDDKLKKFGP
jgi:hypothetical protein